MLYRCVLTRVIWSMLAFFLFSKICHFKSAKGINLQAINWEQPLFRFPTSKLLESISMNSFGHLPSRTHGKQSIVIHTYRHSMLTKVMSTANTLSPVITAIFTANSVINFGIRSMLLVDIVLQI